MNRTAATIAAPTSLAANALELGPRPGGPDTIVLIHGFWVTPRSWEHWVTHYEALGYKVIAPAYPGFEAEVESLNADTTPITELTIDRIVAHLDGIVAALHTPPILIGHSAGGVFVQILLDRGYGAAGIAINSAPTEGVKVIPFQQFRATFPILRNPANRKRAVGLTPEQWKFAFANTMTDEESVALYERYAVPASGSIFFESALANLTPGRQGNWVDYRNDKRAPLLFVAGEKDHLMPPAIQRSNAKHYKSDATTEVVEFPGRAHLLPAQEGWEEVADHVLRWALAHSAS